MGNLVRKCCYLTAVVLFCFASSALANTISMELTAANGPGVIGVIGGPYTFTIGSASNQWAICDDFIDHISVGESWTATVNTSATLANTLFGNNPVKYDEAAWLALQELSVCQNGASCGDISVALWSIFDPSLSLTTSQQGWYDAAVAHATPGDLLSFEILTPYPRMGVGNGEPQEFLYQTPETPTSVLLGAGVLGLLALTVVFRRGMVQTAH